MVIVSLIIKGWWSVPVSVVKSDYGEQSSLTKKMNNDIRKNNPIIFDFIDFVLLLPSQLDIIWSEIINLLDMIYSTISFVLYALIVVTVLFVLVFCVLGFASTFIDIAKYINRRLRHSWQGVGARLDSVIKFGLKDQLSCLLI